MWTLSNKKELKMERNFLLHVYRYFMILMSPVLWIWIKYRLLRGKEECHRIKERFGYPTIVHPKKKIIWLHGASVGEVKTLFPLIPKIVSDYPDTFFLITSATRSSADLIAKNHLPNTYHQYIPLDIPKAVNSFVDYWEPDILIITESEIWPNLLKKTKSKNIPIALINGRFSKKSIKTWGLINKTAQIIFGYFDLIISGDKNTHNFLKSIIGDKVQYLGNLKSNTSCLSVNKINHEKLKTQIGNRLVWCAASTHKGEEKYIISAHKKLREKFPNLLVIMSLRHPERAKSVLKQMGDLSVSIHSHEDEITNKTDIYLIDTIGDMGLAYSLSKITLVCGSLIKGLKGHNPIEPAHFSNAILTGIHFDSFYDTYMSMLDSKAATSILLGDDIEKHVSELLSNPNKLKKKQKLAQNFVNNQISILDSTWNKLSQIISEPKI